MRARPRRVNRHSSTSWSSTASSRSARPRSGCWRARSTSTACSSCARKRCTTVTACSARRCGLLGPRVQLLPHQLYIAAEVASRHAPRVLLADEVGLGKTIESGLIVHQQLTTGRASRVLIAVPDSLVHQWLVEMLRRFNLSFTMLDEERCEALVESGTPNPFEAAQLVLCSLSLLVDRPDRLDQARCAAGTCWSWTKRITCSGARRSQPGVPGGRIARRQGRRRAPAHRHTGAARARGPLCASAAAGSRALSRPGRIRASGGRARAGQLAGRGAAGRRCGRVAGCASHSSRRLPR